MATRFLLEIDTRMLAVVFFFAYKVISLIVGFISVYLGYRLFMAAISFPAGDLEGGGNKLSVKLTKAAPGTFFVVLGTLIILLSIFKGFEFKADSLQGLQ